MSDESLLNKDELQIILGDKYVEPTTANPRVTHDAKAANVLSGLMPGALFERLGLVEPGACWGMTASDFDEGGRVEHLLPGKVWLGPKQRVVLQAAGARGPRADSRPRALSPEPRLCGLRPPPQRPPAPAAPRAEPAVSPQAEMNRAKP